MGSGLAKITVLDRYAHFMQFQAMVFAKPQGKGPYEEPEKATSQSPPPVRGFAEQPGKGLREVSIARATNMRPNAFTLAESLCHL